MNQTPRHQLSYCLLFVLVVRLLTLGFPPLFDPSEGRFASAAQHMVLTGKWLIPEIFEPAKGWTLYLAKPPLHTWLIAGSFKLFGMNTFAARLPSFLEITFVAFLMVLFARRHLTIEKGLLAAILFVCSGGIFFLSCGAITDASLMAEVTLGLVSFTMIIPSQKGSCSKLWGWLFFLALGLGLVTKGPLAILLITIPIFLWLLMTGSYRYFKQLPWIGGSCLALIVGLPWYYATEKVQPGFIRYFLIDENLFRFLGVSSGIQYGTLKRYPHGTIILMFLTLLLPWSLITLKFAKGNFITSLRMVVTEARKSTVMLLLSFYVLVPLFIFTAAKAVLPTYALPIVPPFLLLAVGLSDIKKDNLFCKISSIIVTIYALVAVIGSPMIGSKMSAYHPISWLATNLPAKGQVAIGLPVKIPRSAIFYGEALAPGRFSFASIDSDRTIADQPFDFILLPIKEHPDCLVKYGLIKYRDNHWCLLDLSSQDHTPYVVQ